MRNLADIKLNRQTPCPPRGAVPVNPRSRISSFTHNLQFVFGHGGDQPGYVSRILPGQLANFNVFALAKQAFAPCCLPVKRRFSFWLVVSLCVNFTLI
jgi:hypothetical protein